MPSLSRRLFLQQSSAIPLLASLGIYTCSSQEPQGEKSHEHYRLTDPGPMIPPVPAILLTVNGKSGDPDEMKRRLEDSRYDNG